MKRAKNSPYQQFEENSYFDRTTGKASKEYNRFGAASQGAMQRKIREEEAADKLAQQQKDKKQP